MKYSVTKKLITPGLDFLIMFPSIIIDVMYEELERELDLINGIIICFYWNKKK